MLVTNQLQITAALGRQCDLAGGLGFDGSRGDGVDSDPVLNSFRGEMPGETWRHELGRAVGRLAALTGHSGNRRQADDRSAALAHHLGDRLLAGQKHPARIDVHHPVPVIRSGVENGSERDDARIGNQNVNDPNALTAAVIIAWAAAASATSPSTSTTSAPIEQRSSAAG